MLKQETVDRAVGEIQKGYAEYQYFFDRLNSPAWLVPLQKRGLFCTPPKPIAEGDYVSVPFWPESRYLARMTRLPEAQETVLEIVLRMESTENSHVHYDIADIALALPPILSARLVPKLCECIRIPSPLKLLLSEKIRELIPHLAKGGEGTAALALARAALALIAPARGGGGDEESILPPEPIAQFDTWHYSRILDTAMPSLVSAVGVEAVEMCCELLCEAIAVSTRPGENEDEDYLYIRHPAIERNEDREDIPSGLLVATRDAAEQVIAKSPAQFTTVTRVLAERKFVSFRRLELHLARIFPEHGLEIAERVFQNPEIIERSSLRHEAVLLLKATFPKLSAETQKKLLNWIDNGLPEESVRKWLESCRVEAGEQEVRRYVDAWRRDRLALLQPALPQPYAQRFEELTAALGPPRDLAETTRITGGAIGTRSPKSEDDLGAMPIDDIVSFLASWTPGDTIFDETAAGVGDTLTKVVTRRAEEFATAANRLIGLDPTYVRCFFAGLTAAIKGGGSFGWSPVLELAAWVVAQPREVPGRDGDFMVRDPDWGWTRDSIIDLLTADFEDQPGKLTPANRTQVWQVLKALTDDPYPSPQGEEGDNFDPAFRAINSTRSRALQTVIRYALWVREQTQVHTTGDAADLGTFDAMPEVREVLEAHLDTATEPTLTVRAVYGESLRALAGLDWNWLQANITQIMPTEPEHTRLFRAAWESFVAFCEPHPQLLTILTPAYNLAVDEIGQIESMVRRPSPEERLGEHLLFYYWLGKLDFGGEDSLLERFYRRASAEVRAHATWFIGASVRGWQEDVPGEVLDRLRTLFERRLQAARNAAGPDLFLKELANFGQWFIAGKFDERWALDTLIAVLRLTKEASPDMFVVRRLAELSAPYPLECVTCLRLMIEGDRERWLVLGVEDETRRLLTAALKSNVPDAAIAAGRLTQELIARGHFGFRDLLEQTPREATG